MSFSVTNIELKDLRIEMCNCTETLLSEIACKDFKRESVALTYSFAIDSSEKTDWPKVNAAIIKRWSVSGLKWIKRRAWKLKGERRNQCLPKNATNI